MSHGADERAIHATKIIFEKLQLSRDAGILQIGFKNAFHFIKRSQILTAAATLMPSLASFAIFAIFCNSQHSHLFYSKKSVTSQSGVQEDDPMGLLLFSLTLWSMIEEIESIKPNLTQHCWYLDEDIFWKKPNLARF